jgi:hypothetical protein
MDLDENLLIRGDWRDWERSKVVLGWVCELLERDRAHRGGSGGRHFLNWTEKCKQLLMRMIVLSCQDLKKEEVQKENVKV